MLYICVALFRQEIDLKQFNTYVEVGQHHALPQNVDGSADYEPVGKIDVVHEKIPGEF